MGKKKVEAAPLTASCPHCGYCPHCGRSHRPYPYPYYPYYPYYPVYQYPTTYVVSYDINKSVTTNAATYLT